MKNFPKQVYVTRLDDEDYSELFIDTDAKLIADREEEDTEVAVYQLVKVGVVKKFNKIVFE